MIRLIEFIYRRASAYVVRPTLRLKSQLLLLLMVVGLRQLVTAVEVVESQDDDGLVIDVVEKPSTCDRVSQNGNLLKVHYTGYLANGTEFDTR